MPYANINQLPKHVQKYDAKIQRQWMHVWNTVFTKTMSEDRAFKAANAVLKKRFKSNEQHSQRDKFSYLLDGWLGNLND
tara:strand:+ start:92 stop:328 length:237 start_codon:yes stop_codon:yes gene_type:complete